MNGALPGHVRALLFDLDGVLTDTATVHAAAWKATFDVYLRDRAARDGGDFVPFDRLADYAEYVDGKPRADGIRSFLASRAIEPNAETAGAIGNRKNELVLELIREGGVGPSRRQLRQPLLDKDLGDLPFPRVHVGNRLVRAMRPHHVSGHLPPQRAMTAQ